MIDPDKLLKTLDGGQRAAAQPDDHVWLGASAGTGKTQVLSARVLRLMLAGVSPEAILCITFTKAGAAEMAHRIHERLAMWVRMADGDLRLDLAALGADWAELGILDRARSLFATVIDSPGGAVRVQTIHSFCQTLLASFPLEAKILPGFRALEDSEASALQREVLGQLLARADADGDAMRTIAAMLSQRLGQDAAIAFLARCASSFTAVDAPRIAPRAADLRAQLGLPQGDPLTWQAAALAGGAIADADIASVAASGRGWGTKTGDGRADIMDDWFRADTHGRAAMLTAVRGCFLTGTGDMRADYTKDKGGMRSCLAAAERIVAAADELLATATAMAVADDLASAWDLGSRFAEAYALAKRERGFADFDDLISIAGHLLAQGDFGDWVRFKLDQRTDHILVDEAQDTNARQWAIVASLAGEFFAGVGAKDERVRTMFTVGDRKQAIFGFQGTEPAAFEAARLSFARRATEGGRPFEDVDLDTNYRSSPAVLDVVDAWIAAGAPALMGLESDEPPHIPAEFNRDRAGRVELWQPLPVGKALDADAEEESGAEGDDGDDGAGPRDTAAAASDPASLRLSRAIADEVQDWLLHGKDGRAVAPGDILILVCRRRDLAARIVARLQSLHVPVAGVDRFSLTQSLAVQDLLAAMRFAVQPLDDLNFASLLVSPLFGWSQDDLFGFAHGRQKRALWEQLRTREEEVPPETMAGLRSLLGMGDFTTPFRFLERILSGPLDGRRKLYHRLGREARDPIDELLAQALAFERQEAPSLLGFLTHIAASAAEIKRQSEARGDVVRVMTVHGSKGLQAPIVILADATDDPKSRRVSFDLSMGGWDKLPVFPLGKDERYGAIAEAHDAKERAEREEHWRLLYVAMTRAEDLLIVAGTRKADELPEGNWHSAVDAVMESMGADWQDAGPRWGRKRVHAVHAKKWVRPAKDKARPAVPVVVAPMWATRPAPEEARPPRPLAPSALGEDDVASPPQGGERAAAVTRGLLLHALFERLPPVAPPRRRAAAMHWLAVQASALDESARAAMVDEVLAVLDDPAHAPLFGPGSLAEVPLSAVVDGAVVAGIVDRLLVTDDAVTVIDYKTGRHVPANAADVQTAYLRQMAAYRDALRVIFPGRRVAAALLYTAAPRLIALGDALLDAHKPDLAATKANLPGSALEPDAPTP